MQQEVVPTSPKSSEKKEHTPHPHLVFAVLVVTIVLGFCAGLVGALVAFTVQPQWPILGNFSVSAQLDQLRTTVLLGAPRSSSFVQEVPTVLDQMAAVYARQPVSGEGEEDSYVGTAAILTSDGWMVMPTALFPRPQEGSEETGVVIVLNGESYTMTQSIDDAFSGLTFFSVNAKNLPVIHFAQTNDVPFGNSLSMVSRRLGSYAVMEGRIISETQLAPTIRSTNALEKTYHVDVSQNLPGATVAFTARGEVFGMLRADGTIIESAIINGALQSILTHGSISRSTQNVRYVNTGRLTADERTEKNIPDTGGILIVEAPESSGLQAGDVLMKVNNQNLNRYSDLSSLIHQKPTGTVFYFTIERSGQEQTVEFTS